MTSPAVYKAFKILGPACVTLTCGGCATAFLRSDGPADSRQVYPATKFDGQIFWSAAVKGEPLYVSVDPNERNGALTRVAHGIGAIVDLPFSIVFDTMFLPLDLSRPAPPAKEKGPHDAPGSEAKKGGATRSGNSGTSLSDSKPLS